MPRILTASEIYDPAKGHAAYMEGQREAGNALAGMALAKGDQQKARNALFAGGNLTAGLQLQQMQEQRALAAQQRQRAEQQRAFQALSGVVRQIKTPDQFERVKASVARTLGVDVSKYTFDDLPTLQAQFAQQDKEFALKERELAAQEADKRYQRVGKNLYDVQSGKWLTPPGGTEDKLRTSIFPLPGKEEATGAPVVMQLNSRGEAVRTRLPEGVVYSPGVKTVSTETGTMLIDAKTGQPISRIGKDIQGKQAATVRGKAQGEAQTQFRTANRDARFALETIETLRNHPGRVAATGASATLWSVPGGNAYDFDTKLAEAKAKAFMQARESLKGAGQVTDFEGLKGEQAIANLEQAQSEGQFLAALDQLKRLINASLADLKARAAGDFGVPIQSSAPTMQQLAPVPAPRTAAKPALSQARAQPAQAQAATSTPRPQGATNTQLIAEARAKIAEGAKRLSAPDQEKLKANIRARLKQWGIDF